MIYMSVAEGHLVHPRVCGEHDGTRRDVNPTVGSSPRVRGTRWPVAGGQSAGRFIPACAGNTLELAR